MQTRKINLNEWGDMDDQSQHLILHEKHQTTVDAILEYVRDIPEIKANVRDLQNRMENVELKLDVISGVVKEHSAGLRDVKTRLIRIESSKA